MRRILDLVRERPLVLLLALGVLAGCAAGVQLAKETIQDPGQLLFNGHNNDKITCYHCHNGDGLGSGKGPNLAKKVPKMTDQALLDVMDKGAAFMPAFGDKSTAEERQQILAWLRTSFGGGDAKPAPAVETEAVE